MSIRWTIGAIVAVLTAMLVLPGVASADHHADVNANAECDGTFVIDADYHASTLGTFDSEVYISVNGDNWDDDFGDPSNSDPDYIDIPGPYGTTVGQSNAYVAGGGDDYFAYNNTTDDPDFFVMNGTYDIVVSAGGTITVDADINDTSEDGSASVTDGFDGSWSECVIDYCVDGDSDGATDFSFQASSTNDCAPVRLCVDGESMTVTEFDAATLDGENGSCTPSEDPPVVETEATQEENVPETEVVEPAQEAVAEVSPAIDVVALPSAGYGDAGVNYTWVALFALALTGFGGATALMVRSRK